MLTNIDVVVITMFIISMKSFYSSKHFTNYKLSPTTALHHHPREKGNTVPKSRYEPTGHRVNFKPKTKDLVSMFQIPSSHQGGASIFHLTKTIAILLFHLKMGKRVRGQGMLNFQQSAYFLS